MIVKSGDDLRQEQLAMQLIQTFYSIFKEAEIPLWLRPYSVLAINSNCGFIETVADAVSLDSLKKRVPNFTNLNNYFLAAYGDRTSMPFLQSLRSISSFSLLNISDFVESLAGYSLVCYLLQIKDRYYFVKS